MTFNKSSIHGTVLFTGLLISVLSLPFSIPICHFGILLILLNWILQWNWTEKWKIGKQNSTVLIFISFFAFHLIGLFYSNDFDNSLFNVEKKFSLLVVPLVLATSFISSQKRIILLKSFIVSCFAASTICLAGAFYRLQYNHDASHMNFGFDQPEVLLLNPLFANQWQEFSYVALTSTIGIHPTYFSIYIIFCLSIILINYNKKFFNRFFSIFLILFFTIFLALLSTRITLVAIIGIASIAMIFSIFKLSRNWLRDLSLGGGLLLLFISLSALNPVSFYREFQELQSTPIEVNENSFYSNSTNIRLSLWWIGIKTSMQSNWLYGSGTGNTNEEMQKVASTYHISNSLNTNDPHNQYLNSFISLGAIGLILLIGCYLSNIGKAWHHKDLVNLAFVGLIFTVSFTESFLESQKGIVFFALFQSLFTFRSFDESHSQSLNML